MRVQRVLHRLKNLLFQGIGKVDYSCEIQYWERYLTRNIDQEKTEDLMTRLDPEKRRGVFPERMAFLIQELKLNHEINVLEVASGPVSTLAWGVDQKLFELTAVDVLARKQCELMKRYHYDYPVQPIRCAGEDLLKMFRRGKFDLVYCRDGLDHMKNPPQCFRNMVQVLKEGGVLYLEGHKREETRQKWYGWYNKHDLAPQAGRLLFLPYGKTGAPRDLAGGLGLQCIYEKKANELEGGRYTIIFKKTGKGKNDANQFEESNQETGRRPLERT